MTGKINNIFPIPICVVKVPNVFIPILKSLDKEPLTPDYDPITFGEVSKNTYVLSQKIYSKFKSFIINQVNNYGYNTLGIKSKNWVVTQSWITVKNPNQKHHLHNHSNSLISGVFFYGKNDSNISKLKFYNPYGMRTLQTTFQLDFDRREDINPNDTFFTQYFEVPFTPGTMVLFPSFLPHSVEKNNSNTTRKSLAFNCMPKDIIGSLYGLNELKIGNYE